MPTHRPLKPKPFITVRLASGIEINAASVFMTATYAGVIEGLPYDEINTLHLESLPDQYRKLGTQLPVPVHVVPSEVERFERHGGKDVDPPMMAALLPPIEFAAFFTSHTVKDPANNDASNLIIVWHQHEAVPLMSPAVWAQVENIDWPKLATEWETW